MHGETMKPIELIKESGVYWVDVEVEQNTWHQAVPTLMAPVAVDENRQGQAFDFSEFDPNQNQPVDPEVQHMLSLLGHQPIVQQCVQQGEPVLHIWMVRRRRACALPHNV